MSNKPRTKIINIIDKVAFGFFIILAFFFPISSAIIEISVVFILLCFIVKFIFTESKAKKIKEFFKERINLSLLVFWLCLGLSIFAAGPYYSESIRAWFSKWGEGVFLFYAACIFLDKKKVVFLLKVLLLSSLLISINGLYQFITEEGFVRHFAPNFHPNFTAPRSTFNHYNNFATYLMVLIFIAFGFLFKTKKIFIKAVLVLLTSLLAVNLIFTHSRAGWLSLIMGLCFFIFILPIKKNRKILAGLFFIFFLAVLFIFPVFQARLLGFIQRADAGRFGIWKGAFVMFKDSPLIGQGLGLFMKKIQNYGLEPLYAHNSYLQILAEAGLLAFLPFCWFIGEIFKKCRDNLKRKENIFLISLFSGMLAFLVIMFFDNQLYSLKLSVFFWLIISFGFIYFSSSDLSLVSRRK